MPAEPSAARQELGRLLAARRRASGTNTRDMGEAIGRSHSHVPRVERGTGQISLDEARRWLDRAGAPAAERSTVLALVEAVAAESTAWRLDAGAELQQQAAERIDRATQIESFVWQIVPGLLQTPAYCRRAAARFGVTDLDAYVSARVLRQAVLEQPGRAFRFVICSQVLDHIDKTQRAQIEQADEELAGVAVRVIDFADLPVRATCSFDLHSDDSGPVRVGIELPHGGLELTRAEDLAVYRQLYDQLLEAARPL